VTRGYGGETLGYGGWSPERDGENTATCNVDDLRGLLRTILKAWPLRDENGGPVASSPGAPARRGAAT
jgi:hypothetical protein